MSKTSSRSGSARQRAAAIRAEQERRERRGRLLMVVAAIGAVLLVVVAMVAVKLSQGPSFQDESASGKATGAVVRHFSHVSARTFDAVGEGSAQSVPSKIQAPALSSGGKPRVLYVGAEYCPYCAAQRWPVAVALARFGTWSNVGTTTSSARDVFPSTATLSFHGATYHSRYLAFTGVETTTNKMRNDTYAPLDKISSADRKIEETYNKPPYVQGSGGSIPFVDIANRYVSAGASYSPQLLAGKDQSAIASALDNPRSNIAASVDGSANAITAALCDVTRQRPANVCHTPGVTAAARSLQTGS